ncbi:hypothetical protein Tco_0413323 [Tanacetum coccineum]
MTTLKFADTHNMVAFLSKSTESEGFKQIVDFLNAHTIKYALKINPTIYTSCIEQFWATIKAKTINGEVQLQALVDGKKIIITESIVRRDLQLEDAEGFDCLPNATIFEQLTLMGYEKISQKLTFYKAFFSPQWKFLIHTILQCLSSKTTAWNEFCSTMDSTISCLATNQKFNLSRYIFESMVTNLDNVDNVANKATMREMDIVLERVATTATSLCNTLRSGEDRLKLKELMEFCTKLQQRFLGLENTKIAQAQEITSLKLRVKKLEKKGGSRSHKLKRLYKDMDEKEINVAEKEVSTADPVTTAGEVVTNASPTETTTADDLTLAQTLIKIRNMITELVEGNEVRAEGSETIAEGSSKRAGEELEQESSKKQKLKEDKESEELKQCLEIILDDGDDVRLMLTPLLRSPSNVDMLKNFNKEDLEVLWSIVKARFKNKEPVNYMDNFLLLNLNTMFEYHVEYNVWKNQQILVKVLNLKLYDSCGVHYVTMQSMLFYLLVENMYPLKKHTLHQMFNDVKLQVDYECKMAFELFRLLSMKKLEILKENIKFRGGLLGFKRLHDDLKVTAAKVCVTAAKLKLVLFINSNEKYAK